jgi:hypothetical protein
METIQLPNLDVGNYLIDLDANPKKDIQELTNRYLNFEKLLRSIYAQQPDHKAVQNGRINLVSIFTESQPRPRVRRLRTSNGCIMGLAESEREKEGSLAVGASFETFNNNFRIFSQGSLDKLEWQNIVVAGGAVTACLSKKKEWDSKNGCEDAYPDSDIDIFLYGITETNAREKIIAIETAIRQSTREPTFAVRTNQTVTIISAYPIRHVQIILRIYSSISEILAGFDVDSACTAYDGKEVYATPRALAALVTQCNIIDLTRRSPSYENRLIKFRSRGFETYWPDFDRSLVSPYIAKDHVSRRETGLAKLIAFEYNIHTNEDWKEKYIKKTQVKHIETWLDKKYSASLLSSYHHVTIPYGTDYTLVKTEKVLLEYKNKREEPGGVTAHAHVFFLGSASEIIADYCRNCPEFTRERKNLYVSGKIKFISDDPGRQQSGSFNPITGVSDWALGI